ncbi:MAG: hypothetical protein D6761_03845, partial [Candidatus Dadabacteria bacterium]
MSDPATAAPSFVRHGAVYAFTALLGKAAGLVAIPVLTRLMAPDDYGTYQVVLTYAQIGAVILTGNMYGAISRYYFDDRPDFNQFLSNSLAATAILLALSATALLLSQRWWSGWFSFPKQYAPLILVGVAAHTVFAIYRHTTTARRASSEAFRIEVARDYLALL